jgi:CBS domain-containing protein
MPPHFKIIGEITITNKLVAMEDAPAYDVALRLLETSFQGLPVLNRSGKVVGKVTEMDLLKALKNGRYLKQIRVKDIMAPAPPVVSTETPLERAVEIMDAHHLIRLPVMKGSRFIGSVTRHDLLRAWLGYWVDHERGDYAQVIG